MSDPAALRPLDEAADAIRRLVEYQNREELESAVTEVADAVERSLRIRLRDDVAASDDERMSALSPDLPLDEVVKSLRARDLISLEAAGSVHGLRRAIARARESGARPADADTARDAVTELRKAFGPAASTSADPAPADSAPGGEAQHDAPNGSSDTGSSREAESIVGGSGRWVARIGALIALAALIGLAWVVTRGNAREYDRAVAAFRAEQLDSAAARFEALVEDRPEDVTARLYLARTYRRLGRTAEAAELLRGTVARAPDDADVRRELGHLFMDLERPESAVRQYERALEQDPGSSLNWAALIRALRAAGDPRAEALLKDAPAEVQAALGAAAGTGGANGPEDDTETEP